MQEEASLFVKIAGVIIAGLTFITTLIGVLWRSATKQFVKRTEMNERFESERASIETILEKQHKAYLQSLESHGDEEMALFKSQDHRLEEMNQIIKQLSNYLQQIPSRSEFDYQQRTVDSLKTSIDELTKNIHHISGRLEITHSNNENKRQ